MGRRAYVLVNNRAEGNAPLTVRVLTEMICASTLDATVPHRIG